jgi:hypothetical protein
MAINILSPVLSEIPFILGPTSAPGACDYPTQSNVRLGIQFGNGTFTGNVVLPPVDQVVLGVGYGANGTEFIGTFTTPLIFPPPTGDWPVQSASYEQILDAIRIQLMKYTGFAEERVREWYSDSRPMFGDDALITYRPTNENPFKNAGAGRLGTKLDFGIRVTFWQRYQQDDAGTHRLWGRQVLAMRRLIVSALHDHMLFDSYDVNGDPLATAQPLLYKVIQYVPSDTFEKGPVLSDGKSVMDFEAGAVLMVHVPNLVS